MEPLSAITGIPNQNAAIAILHIGRMDDGVQQQP
jgi:hypothetical protein